MNNRGPYNVNNYPNSSFQPVTNNFQPANNAVQPIAGVYHPINPTFQPVTTTFQPVNTAVQLMNGGYQPMNSGYQSMNSGYQSMNNGYQSMNSGYQSMNGGYQPMTTTFPPANSTVQPMNGGYQPMNASFQSANNVFRPVNTAFQPAITAVQPMNGGYQPMTTFQSANSAVQPIYAGYQEVNTPFQPANTAAPQMNGGYQPSQQNLGSQNLNGPTLHPNYRHLLPQNEANYTSSVSPAPVQINPTRNYQQTPASRPLQPFMMRPAMSQMGQAFQPNALSSPRQPFYQPNSRFNASTSQSPANYLSTTAMPVYDPYNETGRVVFPSNLFGIYESGSQTQTLGQRFDDALASMEVRRPPVNDVDMIDHQIMLTNCYTQGEWDECKFTATSDLWSSKSPQSKEMQYIIFTPKSITFDFDTSSEEIPFEQIVETQFCAVDKYSWLFVVIVKDPEDSDDHVNVTEEENPASHLQQTVTRGSGSTGSCQRTVPINENSDSNHETDMSSKKCYTFTISIDGRIVHGPLHYVCGQYLKSAVKEECLRVLDGYGVPHEQFFRDSTQELFDQLESAKRALQAVLNTLPPEIYTQPPALEGLQTYEVVENPEADDSIDVESI